MMSQAELVDTARTVAQLSGDTDPTDETLLDLYCQLRARHRAWVQSATEWSKRAPRVADRQIVSNVNSPGAKLFYDPAAATALIAIFLSDEKKPRSLR